MASKRQASGDADGKLVQFGYVAVPVAFQRGHVQEDLDYVIFAGFVDAADEFLLASAGLPVHAAQSVGCAPFTDARGAQRIFEETSLHAGFAERIAGGQAQLGYGIDPRIDDQVLLRGATTAPRLKNPKPSPVTAALGQSGESLARCTSIS